MDLIHTKTNLCRLNRFHIGSAVGYLLCMTPLNIVLVAYFAIFSFANPDDTKCFVNLEKPEEAYASRVGETDIDVSLRFRIWFICGLVMYSLITFFDLCHAFGIFFKIACCLDTW